MLRNLIIGMAFAICMGAVFVATVVYLGPECPSPNQPSGDAK